MSDPTLQKKPSWVKPTHDQTIYQPPHPFEIKQSVTIKYSNPGTQPPVYVATSLTNPAWEPTEMEYTVQNDALYFFKNFTDAKEGTHQYKFRLGPGDWWVLDENAPTVHDGDGNQNNLIVVRADTAANLQLRDSNANDDPGSRARIDSADPAKTTDIPAVVVDKVDAMPVHGDDLGPNATEGQKVAHELRAADAQPDETHIRPTASDDQQISGLAEPASTDKASEDRPSHDNNYESPRQENAPLFAHERMDEPSWDTESDSLNVIDEKDGGSRTVQDSEYTAAVDHDPQTREESPHREAPLFSYECASSREQLPGPSLKLEVNQTSPQRPSARNKRNKVDQASDDEDEGLRRDPSIERFPDTREDIMMHLQRTGSRLGHDDSDRVDGTPPSPLITKVSSPRLSRSGSDTSHSPITPLNDIREDPIAEDDEAEKDEIQSNKQPVSNGESSKELSGALPNHSPKSSVQRKTTDDQNPAENGRIVVNGATSAALSPPTPPMTPKQAFNGDQETFVGPAYPEKNISKATAPEDTDGRPGLSTNTSRANGDPGSSKSIIASTPVIDSALRQRRPDSDGNVDNGSYTQSSPKAPSPSSDRRAGTPLSDSSLLQNENHETALHALWRVLSGAWLLPLGHWLARLCGGRRNAAGIVALGVLATWATGYFLHPSDILASVGRQGPN